MKSVNRKKRHLITPTATETLLRLEEQVKKNLKYFENMKKRQMVRKRNHCKDWEKTFLARETWTNLRLACRGFFGYCRYMIHLAEITPDTVRPKSVHRHIRVSPAHSNTSAIEAWFSQSRKDRLDLATNYESMVGNKHLLKSTSSVDYLRNNKLYDKKDIGEVSHGNIIGPRELERYHRNRIKRTREMIESYHKSLTYQDGPMQAMSQAILLKTNSLTEIEKKVLNCISTKTIPNNYPVFITQQATFHRLLRLSIDSPSHTWFTYFFEDTCTSDDAKKFNDTCIQIQDMFLDFTLQSIKNINTNNGKSWEELMYQFIRSVEVSTICWTSLPGRLAECNTSYSMLSIMIADLHLRWIQEALRDTIISLKPDYFMQKSSSNLTVAEENNEVNRFLGWAIFSTRLNLQQNSIPSLNTDANKIVSNEILSCMLVREGQIDDEYLLQYYDLNMEMLNHGGLTLVSREFFEWGRDLMKIVRENYSEESINMDPVNSFKAGKHNVLGNDGVKRDFMACCEKLCPGAHPTVVTIIFDNIVTKTIHAKFGYTFRRWKEKNVKKHENLALRTKLKAHAKSANKSNDKGTTFKAASNKTIKAISSSEESSPSVSTITTKDHIEFEAKTTRKRTPETTATNIKYSVCSFHAGVANESATKNRRLRIEKMKEKKTMMKKSKRMRLKKTA